jgi:hypothetical protein
MLSKLMLAPLLALMAFLGAGFEPVHEVNQEGIVWSETTKDGVLLALHDNGHYTASVLSEGAIVTSTTAPQGQGPAATPTLTTTYTGADGSIYTVTTPIASTTPAGMKSAMTTHQTLLALMKVTFPPAP